VTYGPVDFEAFPPDGMSQQKTEEIRATLKELKLSEVALRVHKEPEQPKYQC